MIYEIKVYDPLPQYGENFTAYVVTDSVDATNVIIHQVLYKNPTHEYLLSRDCINELERIRVAWDIPCVIMVFKHNDGEMFGEIMLYCDNKIIPKQSLNGGVEFQTAIYS
jgi:hypothetical protein